jgi:hypothetical protein
MDARSAFTIKTLSDTSGTTTAQYCCLASESTILANLEQHPLQGTQMMHNIETAQRTGSEALILLV